MVHARLAGYRLTKAYRRGDGGGAGQVAAATVRHVLPNCAADERFALHGGLPHDPRFGVAAGGRRSPTVVFPAMTLGTTD